MTEAEPHACSPKPRSLLPGGHVAPSVSEKLAEPTSCHQPISFPVPLESNPHPGGEVRGRRKAALLQESQKQGPVQEGRCSNKGRLGDGSLQLSPCYHSGLRRLRKLGQGWRLPGVNTKPLPWSWAFSEVLESSGDLEDLEEAHQATVTQRGQAGDSDHPQEGKAPQEPRFWCPRSLVAEPAWTSFRSVQD